MPPPDERSVLFDIRTACRRVVEGLERVDSGLLLDDWLVQAALERLFSVIGEAVKLLPAETKQAIPQVHWSGWAGLRDVLAHAYWRVDRDELFRLAATEVPELLAAVETMLAELTDRES